MVLCLELYNDRSTLERFTKLLSPLFSLGPWIYRALMCRKLEIMKGNSSMAVNWWYWCELEVSYMVFAVLYHALSNLRFLWFFFSGSSFKSMQQWQNKETWRSLFSCWNNKGLPLSPVLQPQKCSMTLPHMFNSIPQRYGFPMSPQHLCQI